MNHEKPPVGAGTMEPPRRSFFYKLLTVTLGAVLPMPALAAAFMAFVDPLFPARRKKQAPSGSEAIGNIDGFFRTISSDTLSTQPQLVQIIADKKDAWNTYPKAPIGAVYVQKTSDARLALEQDWKEIESLKAAVEQADAAKRDQLFEELLSTEFSLRKRAEERTGHHWEPGDSARLVDEYKKAFPERAAVVTKVGQSPAWEGGVRVFNVLCPHAGCAVDYRAEGKGSFFCPCHNSQFAIHGARSEKSPSARDLDTLDYVVKEGVVLVRFMNFEAGHAAKHPV
jgi:Rieske Fe-S protein